MRNNKDAFFELQRRLWCFNWDLCFDHFDFYRVFASTMSENALLLEGPTSVEKTAVVEQVCRFESHSKLFTSPRVQLLSICLCRFSHSWLMKRCYLNCVYIKLVKALKEKKWILLDEINFANAQVFLIFVEPKVHLKYGLGFQRMRNLWFKLFLSKIYINLF